MCTIDLIKVGCSLQVSAPANIRLFGAYELLDLVPFEENMKNSLKQILSSLSHPILGDWSIIALLTMLMIFRQESTVIVDPIAENIKRQLWTMLRRHLQNKTSSPHSLQGCLAHIEYCVHMLPMLLVHEKEIFSKFV